MIFLVFSVAAGFPVLVLGPFPKFVFNVMFNDEGSACVTAVSVHSEVTFTAYKTIPQILSLLLQMCMQVVLHSLERKGTRKWLSLSSF